MIHFLLTPLKWSIAKVWRFLRSELLTFQRGRLRSCRVLWKHSVPATETEQSCGNQKDGAGESGDGLGSSGSVRPSWWDWSCSVSGRGRDEAPGAEEEEEGVSWTGRSSPAERRARPASSCDSPVCSSAERRGSGPRQGRTDGWAWRDAPRHHNRAKMTLFKIKPFKLESRFESIFIHFNTVNRQVFYRLMS